MWHTLGRGGGRGGDVYKFLLENRLETYVIWENKIQRNLKNSEVDSVDLISTIQDVDACRVL
jgi:hypothetical protein